MIKDYNFSKRFRPMGGAALITSLIMLVGMTTLAVISMENSLLQLKMVNNSQKSKEAFECTLSELEAQFDESAENNSSILDTLHKARYNAEVDSNGNLTYHSVNAASIAPCNGSTSFTVLYTGTVNLNNTLNDDTSAGTYEYLSFNFEAESAIAGNFKSKQILGINRISRKNQ